MPNTLKYKATSKAQIILKKKFYVEILFEPIHFFEDGLE